MLICPHLILFSPSQLLKALASQRGNFSPLASPVSSRSGDLYPHIAMTPRRPGTSPYVGPSTPRFPSVSQPLDKLPSNAYSDANNPYSPGQGHRLRYLLSTTGSRRGSGTLHITTCRELYEDTRLTWMPGRMRPRSIIPKQKDMALQQRFPDEASDEKVKSEMHWFLSHSPPN